MSNEEKNQKYNLEERTTKFGEEVIDLAKKIPVNYVSKRLIPQLIASGTAVGANYCEADCAESNKDFIHKMSIANKEAKESKYFLRMGARVYPNCSKEARRLWKEAYELNLIFTSIIRKSKNKLTK